MLPPSVNNASVFFACAALSAPLQGVPIYFKVYDVDDPSTNVVIDPNGVRGADNNGSPQSGAFVTSGSRETSATTDTNGVAVADFDATYAGYAEFQQQMEFYWCLRFIQQEHIEKLTARVIRENLVRFDRLPVVQRINDMPHQPPGTQVILAVAEIDLFEPALHLRFIEAVPGTANAATTNAAATAA